MFQLYNTDARELPGYLPQDGKVFDCIEIANICDRGYIGPERTLFTFAPLLQPKAQNPKANILMLFLKAAKEIEIELGTRYQAADLPRRMERLTNLIGVDTDMMARIAIDNKTVPYDLGFFCISKLHARFADFDELFDLFLRAAQMDEFEKANRVKTKRQHSLVEKWTYRVTNRTSKKTLIVFARKTLADGSVRWSWREQGRST